MVKIKFRNATAEISELNQQVAKYHIKTRYGFCQFTQIQQIFYLINLLTIIHTNKNLKSPNLKFNISTIKTA